MVDLLVLLQRGLELGEKSDLAGAAFVPGGSGIAVLDVRGVLANKYFETVAEYLTLLGMGLKVKSSEAAGISRPTRSPDFLCSMVTSASRSSSMGGSGGTSLWFRGFY